MLHRASPCVPFSPIMYINRGSDTTNQGVGALSIAVDLFDDNIYVGGFNYATSFTFAGKVVANNGNSGTGDMTIVVYSKEGNQLWAKVSAAIWGPAHELRLSPPMVHSSQSNLTSDPSPTICSECRRNGQRRPVVPQQHCRRWEAQGHLHRHPVVLDKHRERADHHRQPVPYVSAHLQGRF